MGLMWAAVDPGVADTGLCPDSVINYYLAPDTWLWGSNLPSTAQPPGSLVGTDANPTPVLGPLGHRRHRAPSCRDTRKSPSVTFSRPSPGPGF